MEVLMVLVATSLACSILGSFIVLRKQSMTADALSHSVLLGIVLAFIIVKDLDSIYLKIGAAIFGVFTVFVVELLSHNKKIKSDDALGIVFPIFFSIAVVIISKYFRNVHLDTDMVLLGNPLFSPFLRIGKFPRAFVVMMIMFLLNLIFVFVFYRSLKLSSFDDQFARMNGIKQKLLFYSFMSLVSLTCVLAFDTVGAILSISFFVTPSACAYLLAKDLKQMIAYSLGFAILNTIAGYFFAMQNNVSITGMISFIAMIVCFIVVLFYPKGYLYKKLEQRKIKTNLESDLIMIHIFRHDGDLEELGEESIHRHINWPKKKMDMHLQELVQKRMIYYNQKRYWLTELGKERIKWLLEK